MSRFKGTFIFGANFEVGIEGPLDARQVVGCYSDLTLPATWCLSPSCSNIALYNGMIVAVGSDPTPSYNGIYYLCDAPNYTMTCSWIKAGTGSGIGTITGATNGLSLVGVSGATIALGGLLTSGTTINGQNLYELNLVDLAGFHVSGGTSEIILEPGGITLTHSGTTVSLDSNAGLTYDGDYSSTYNIRSLPDVGFVTGLTSSKLPITTFSAYTASTTGIISNAVTGATNGLTKIPNHDVCLGGTITAPVIITDSRGTPTGIEYGSDYSATFVDESLITKRYADTIVSGLRPKEAVVVTTVSGITLSGLTTVDGVLLTTGDRVLVKNQGIGVTGATTNGIYSASTGTWGRTADFDGTPIGEVVSGAYVWVLTGTTNENTAWVLDTPDPITVGVTPMSFVVFANVADVIAGTGITVIMQTGVHIVSLDNQTQNVLAQSVTGVTNCGAGATVCSSKVGNNLALSTIKGSGGTTVQKVGDEVIICSTTVGGSQLYSGQTPSAVNLCGICIGYQLTGKTVSCIIQDLLVPELFQTFVGTPSTSVAATLTGILEIGCNFSQTITPTYSAGAITPLYCSTSPFCRGGAANDYSYAGPSLSTGFFGCTSCNIPSYTVTSGAQTWCVCTKYNAGSCIKGSKGTVNPSYPTICPLNSCTANGSASITGILPWYWGTSAVGTITNAIVTGGTKTIATVGASTPITFNAVTQFLWFAAPTGTYTTKTKWWVCAANAGNIGGTGELWKQQGTLSVTSGQGCWSGCSFDVYVTCGITTTAVGIPMCLYY